MARQGIEMNPKFLRLSQALHQLSSMMGDALARGLLEQLWDSAYTAADDNVGEAGDLEARAKWRGPAGALAELLAAEVGGRAGFIEPDEERGGFRLHDFWEHAPPWVRKKAECEARRKAAGKTISDLRREAGRIGAAARKSKTTCQQEHEHLPDHLLQGQQSADRLPVQTVAKDPLGKGREGKGYIAPEQTVDRLLAKQPPLPLEPEQPEQPVTASDLDAVYKLYPRKRGRTAGMAIAVKEVVTRRDLADFTDAVNAFARSMTDEERPDDKILYFSTFMLNWRDWVPPPEERAEQADKLERAKRRGEAAQAAEESGRSFL